MLNRERGKKRKRMRRTPTVPSQMPCARRSSPFACMQRAEIEIRFCMLLNYWILMFTPFSFFLSLSLSLPFLSSICHMFRNLCWIIFMQLVRWNMRMFARMDHHIAMSLEGHTMAMDGGKGTRTICSKTYGFPEANWLASEAHSKIHVSK